MNYSFILYQNISVTILFSQNQLFIKKQIKIEGGKLFIIGQPNQIGIKQSSERFQFSNVVIQQIISKLKSDCFFQDAVAVEDDLILALNTQGELYIINKWLQCQILSGKFEIEQISASKNAVYALTQSNELLEWDILSFKKLAFVQGMKCYQPEQCPPTVYQLNQKLESVVFSNCKNSRKISITYRIKKGKPSRRQYSIGSAMPKSSSCLFDGFTPLEQSGCMNLLDSYFRSPQVKNRSPSRDGSIINDGDIANRSNIFNQSINASLNRSPFRESPYRQMKKMSPSRQFLSQLNSRSPSKNFDRNPSFHKSHNKNKQSQMNYQGNNGQQYHVYPFAYINSQKNSIPSSYVFGNPFSESVSRKVSIDSILNQNLTKNNQIANSIQKINTINTSINNNLFQDINLSKNQDPFNSYRSKISNIFGDAHSRNQSNSKKNEGVQRIQNILKNSTSRNQSPVYDDNSQKNIFKASKDDIYYTQQFEKNKFLLKQSPPQKSNINQGSQSDRGRRLERNNFMEKWNQLKPKNSNGNYGYNQNLLNPHQGKDLGYFENLIHEKADINRSRKSSNSYKNILPQEIFDDMKYATNEFKQQEKNSFCDEMSYKQINDERSRFGGNQDSFIFTSSHKGNQINNSHNIQNSSFINGNQNMGSKYFLEISGKPSQRFNASPVRMQNSFQNIGDIDQYIRRSQNDIDNLHRQQIAFEEQLERQGSPNKVIKIFSDDDDLEYGYGEESNNEKQLVKGGLDLFDNKGSNSSRDNTKINAIKNQISQLLENLQNSNVVSSGNTSSRLNSTRKGTNAPHQSTNNSPSFGQSRQNSQNQKQQQEKINRIRDKINQLQSQKARALEYAEQMQIQAQHQNNFMKNKSRSNNADSTTLREEDRDFDMSSVQQPSIIQSPTSSNFLSPNQNSSLFQPYFISQKNISNNQTQNLQNPISQNENKRVFVSSKKPKGIHNTDSPNRDSDENPNFNEQEIHEEPLETNVSMKERRDTVEPDLNAALTSQRNEKRLGQNQAFMQVPNNQYLLFASRKGSFQDSAPLHTLMIPEEIRQNQIQQQHQSNLSINASGQNSEGGYVTDDRFTPILNAVKDPIQGIRKQSSFWSDADKLSDNLNRKDLKKILDEQEISGINSDRTGGAPSYQGMGGASINNIPYNNNFGQNNNQQLINPGSQQFDDMGSTFNNNNFYAFNRGSTQKMSLIQPHSFTKNPIIGDSEDQDYQIPNTNRQNQQFNQNDQNFAKQLYYQPSVENQQYGQTQMPSTQYQTQITSFPNQIQGENTSSGNNTNNQFNLRQAFTQFLNSDNADQSNIESTPRRIEKKVEEIRNKIKGSTPVNQTNNNSQSQQNQLSTNQEIQNQEERKTQNIQKECTDEEIEFQIQYSNKINNNKGNDKKSNKTEIIQEEQEIDNSQKEILSNKQLEEINLAPENNQKVIKQKSSNFIQNDRQQDNPIQVSSTNPLNLSGENLNSDRNHHNNQHNLSNQLNRELFKDEEEQQQENSQISESRFDFQRNNQDVQQKNQGKQKDQDDKKNNNFEKKIVQNYNSEVQENEEEKEDAQDEQQEIQSRKDEEKHLLDQIQQQEQNISVKRKQQISSLLALKVDKLVLKRLYYSFKKVSDHTNQQKLEQEELRSEERRLVKQRESASNIFRKIQQITKLRKQEAMIKLQKIARNKEFRNKQFLRILENIMKQYKQRQYFEFFMNCQQSRVYLRGQYANVLSQRGNDLNRILQRHLQKRYLLRWKKNAKRIALLMRQMQLNQNVFNLTLNNFSKILKSKVITRLNQAFDKLQFFSEMLEAKKINYEQQLLLEQQQEELQQLEYINSQQKQQPKSTVDFDIEFEPDLVIPDNRDEMIKQSNKENINSFGETASNINHPTQQTAPYTDRNIERYQDTIENERDEASEKELQDSIASSLNAIQGIQQQDNYSLPSLSAIVSQARVEKQLQEKPKDDSRNDQLTLTSQNLLTEEKSGKDSQLYEMSVSQSSGSKHKLDSNAKNDEIENSEYSDDKDWKQDGDDHDLEENQNNRQFDQNKENNKTLSSERKKNKKNNLFLNNIDDEPSMIEKNQDKQFLPSIYVKKENGEKIESQISNNIQQQESNNQNQPMILPSDYQSKDIFSIIDEDIQIIEENSDKQTINQISQVSLPIENQQNRRELSLQNLKQSQELQMTQTKMLSHENSNSDNFEQSNENLKINQNQQGNQDSEFEKREKNIDNKELQQQSNTIDNEEEFIFRRSNKYVDGITNKQQDNVDDDKSDIDYEQEDKEEESARRSSKQNYEAKLDQDKHINDAKSFDQKINQADIDEDHMFRRSNKYVDGVNQDQNQNIIDDENTDQILNNSKSEEEYQLRRSNKYVDGVTNQFQNEEEDEMNLENNKLEKQEDNLNRNQNNNVDENVIKLQKEVVQNENQKDESMLRSPEKEKISMNQEKKEDDKSDNQIVQNVIQTNNEEEFTLRRSNKYVDGNEINQNSESNIDDDKTVQNLISSNNDQECIFRRSNKYVDGVNQDQHKNMIEDNNADQLLNNSNFEGEYSLRRSNKYVEGVTLDQYQDQEENEIMLKNNTIQNKEDLNNSNLNNKVVENGTKLEKRESQDKNENDEQNKEEQMQINSLKQDNSIIQDKKESDNNDKKVISTNNEDEFLLRRSNKYDEGIQINQNPVSNGDDENISQNLISSNNDQECIFRRSNKYVDGVNQDQNQNIIDDENTDQILNNSNTEEEYQLRRSNKHVDGVTNQFQNEEEDEMNLENNKLEKQEDNLNRNQNNNVDENVIKLQKEVVQNENQKDESMLRSPEKEKISMNQEKKEDDKSDNQIVQNVIQTNNEEEFTLRRSNKYVDGNEINQNSESNIDDDKIVQNLVSNNDQENILRKPNQYDDLVDQDIVNQDDEDKISDVHPQSKNEEEIVFRRSNKYVDGEILDQKNENEQDQTSNQSNNEEEYVLRRSKKYFDGVTENEFQDQDQNKNENEQRDENREQNNQEAQFFGKSLKQDNEDKNQNDKNQSHANKEEFQLGRSIKNDDKIEINQNSQINNDTDKITKNMTSSNNDSENLLRKSNQQIQQDKQQEEIDIDTQKNNPQSNDDEELVFRRSNKYVDGVAEEQSQNIYNENNMDQQQIQNNDQEEYVLRRSNKYVQGVIEGQNQDQDDNKLFEDTQEQNNQDNFIQRTNNQKFDDVSMNEEKNKNLDKNIDILNEQNSEETQLRKSNKQIDDFFSDQNDSNKNQNVDGQNQQQEENEFSLRRTNKYIDGTQLNQNSEGSNESNSQSLTQLNNNDQIEQISETNVNQQKQQMFDLISETQQNQHTKKSEQNNEKTLQSSDTYSKQQQDQQINDQGDENQKIQNLQQQHELSEQANQNFKSNMNPQSDNQNDLKNKENTNLNKQQNQEQEEEIQQLRFKQKEDQYEHDNSQLILNENQEKQIDQIKSQEKLNNGNDKLSSFNQLQELVDQSPFISGGQGQDMTQYTSLAENSNLNDTSSIQKQQLGELDPNQQNQQERKKVDGSLSDINYDDIQERQINSQNLLNLNNNNHNNISQPSLYQKSQLTYSSDSQIDSKQSIDEQQQGQEISQIQQEENNQQFIDKKSHDENKNIKQNLQTEQINSQFEVQISDEDLELDQPIQQREEKTLNVERVDEENTTQLADLKITQQGAQQLQSKQQFSSFQSLENQIYRDGDVQSEDGERNLQENIKSTESSKQQGSNNIYYSFNSFEEKSESSQYFTAEQQLPGQERRTSSSSSIIHNPIIEESLDSRTVLEQIEEETQTQNNSIVNSKVIPSSRLETPAISQTKIGSQNEINNNSIINTSQQADISNIYIHSAQSSPTNANKQIGSSKKQQYESLANSQQAQLSHLTISPNTSEHKFYAPEISEDDQKLIDSEIKDQVHDNLISNINFVKQESLQRQQVLKEQQNQQLSSDSIPQYQELVQSILPTEIQREFQDILSQQKQITRQEEYKQQQPENIQDNEIIKENDEGKKKFESLIQQLTEQEKIFDDQEMIKFTEENDEENDEENMNQNIQGQVTNSQNNNNLINNSEVIFQNDSINHNSGITQEYVQSQDLNNETSLNQNENNQSIFVTPQKQQTLADFEKRIVSPQDKQLSEGSSNENQSENKVKDKSLEINQDAQSQNSSKFRSFFREENEISSEQKEQQEEIKKEIASILGLSDDTISNSENTTQMNSLTQDEIQTARVWLFNNPEKSIRDYQQEVVNQRISQQENINLKQTYKNIQDNINDENLLVNQSQNQDQVKILNQQNYLSNQDEQSNQEKLKTDEKQMNFEKYQQMIQSNINQNSQQEVQDSSDLKIDSQLAQANIQLKNNDGNDQIGNNAQSISQQQNLTSLIKNNTQQIEQMFLNYSSNEQNIEDQPQQQFQQQDESDLMSGRKINMNDDPNQNDEFSVNKSEQINIDQTLQTQTSHSDNESFVKMSFEQNNSLNDEIINNQKSDQKKNNSKSQLSDQNELSKKEIKKYLSDIYKSIELPGDENDNRLIHPFQLQQNMELSHLTEESREYTIQTSQEGQSPVHDSLKMNSQVLSDKEADYSLDQSSNYSQDEVNIKKYFEDDLIEQSHNREQSKQKSQKNQTKQELSISNQEINNYLQSIYQNCDISNILDEDQNMNDQRESGIHELSSSQNKNSMDNFLDQSNKTENLKQQTLKNKPNQVSSISQLEMNNYLESIYQSCDAQNDVTENLNISNQNQILNNQSSRLESSNYSKENIVDQNNIKEDPQKQQQKSQIKSVSSLNQLEVNNYLDNLYQNCNISRVLLEDQQMNSPSQSQDHDEYSQEHSQFEDDIVDQNNIKEDPQKQEQKSQIKSVSSLNQLEVNNYLDNLYQNCNISKVILEEQQTNNTSQRQDHDQCSQENSNFDDDIVDQISIKEDLQKQEQKTQIKSVSSLNQLEVNNYLDNLYQNCNISKVLLEDQQMNSPGSSQDHDQYSQEHSQFEDDIVDQINKKEDPQKQEQKTQIKSVSSLNQLEVNSYLDNLYQNCNISKVILEEQQLNNPSQKQDNDQSDQQDSNFEDDNIYQNNIKENPQKQEQKNQIKSVSSLNQLEVNNYLDNLYQNCNISKVLLENQQMNSPSQSQDHDQCSQENSNLEDDIVDQIDKKEDPQKQEQKTQIKSVSSLNQLEVNNFLDNLYQNCNISKVLLEEQQMNSPSQSQDHDQCIQEHSQVEDDNVDQNNIKEDPQKQEQKTQFRSVSSLNQLEVNSYLDNLYQDCNISKVMLEEQQMNNPSSRQDHDQCSQEYSSKISEQNAGLNKNVQSFSNDNTSSQQKLKENKQEKNQNNEQIDTPQLDQLLAITQIYNQNKINIEKEKESQISQNDQQKQDDINNYFDENTIPDIQGIIYIEREERQIRSAPINQQKETNQDNNIVPYKEEIIDGVNMNFLDPMSNNQVEQSNMQDTQTQLILNNNFVTEQKNNSEQANQNIIPSSLKVNEDLQQNSQIQNLSSTVLSQSENTNFGFNERNPLNNNMNNIQSYINTINPRDQQNEQTNDRLEQPLTSDQVHQFTNNEKSNYSQSTIEKDENRQNKGMDDLQISIQEQIKNKNELSSAVDQIKNESLSNVPQNTRNNDLLQNSIYQSSQSLQQSQYQISNQDQKLNESLSLKQQENIQSQNQEEFNDTIIRNQQINQQYGESSYSNLNQISNDSQITRNNSLIQNIRDQSIESPQKQQSQTNNQEQFVNNYLSLQQSENGQKPNQEELNNTIIRNQLIVQQFGESSSLTPNQILNRGPISQNQQIQNVTSKNNEQQIQMEELLTSQPSGDRIDNILQNYQNSLPEQYQNIQVQSSQIPSQNIGASDDIIQKINNIQPKNIENEYEQDSQIPLKKEDAIDEILKKFQNNKQIDDVQDECINLQSDTVENQLRFQNNQQLNIQNQQVNDFTSLQKKDAIDEILQKFNKNNQQNIVNQENDSQQQKDEIDDTLQKFNNSQNISNEQILFNNNQYQVNDVNEQKLKSQKLESDAVDDLLKKYSLLKQEENQDQNNDQLQQQQGIHFIDLSSQSNNRTIDEILQRHQANKIHTIENDQAKDPNEQQSQIYTVYQKTNNAIDEVLKKFNKQNTGIQEQEQTPNQQLQENINSDLYLQNQVIDDLIKKHKNPNVSEQQEPSLQNHMTSILDPSFLLVSQNNINPLSNAISIGNNFEGQNLYSIDRLKDLAKNQAESEGFSNQSNQIYNLRNPFVSGEGFHPERQLNNLKQIEENVNSRIQNNIENEKIDCNQNNKIIQIFSNKEGQNIQESLESNQGIQNVDQVRISNRNDNEVGSSLLVPGENQHHIQFRSNSPEAIQASFSSLRDQSQNEYDDKKKINPLTIEQINENRSLNQITVNQFSKPQVDEQFQLENNQQRMEFDKSEQYQEFSSQQNIKDNQPSISQLNSNSQQMNIPLVQGSQQPNYLSSSINPYDDLKLKQTHSYGTSQQNLINNMIQSDVLDRIIQGTRGFSPSSQPNVLIDSSVQNTNNTLPSANINQSNFAQMRGDISSLNNQPQEIYQYSNQHTFPQTEQFNNLTQDIKKYNQDDPNNYSNIAQQTGNNQVNEYILNMTNNQNTQNNQTGGWLTSQNNKLNDCIEPVNSFRSNDFSSNIGMNNNSLSQNGIDDYNPVFIKSSNQLDHQRGDNPITNEQKYQRTYDQQGSDLGVNMQAQDLGITDYKPIFIQSSTAFDKLSGNKSDQNDNQKNQNLQLQNLGVDDYKPMIVQGTNNQNQSMDQETQLNDLKKQDNNISQVSNLGISNYQPMILKSTNTLDDQINNPSNLNEYKQQNDMQSVNPNSALSQPGYPITSTEYGVNPYQYNSLPFNGYSSPIDTIQRNQFQNNILPQNQLYSQNLNFEKAKGKLDEEEEERKEQPSNIQNYGTEMYQTQINSYPSPFEINIPNINKEHYAENYKKSSLPNSDSNQVSPINRIENFLNNQQDTSRKDITQDYLGSEHNIEQDLNNSQILPNSSFISQGNVDFLIRPQSQFTQSINPTSSAQNQGQFMYSSPQENIQGQQTQYPNFLDNIHSRNNSRDSSFTANFSQPQFYSQTSSPVKIQGSAYPYQSTQIQAIQTIQQPGIQAIRHHAYSHSAHQSPLPRGEFKPVIKQTIIKQQVVSQSTSQIIYNSQHSITSVDSLNNSINPNQIRYQNVSSLPPQHPGILRSQVTPVKILKIGGSQTDLNNSAVIYSPQQVVPRILNHSSSQIVHSSQNPVIIPVAQPFVRVAQISPVKTVSVINHTPRSNVSIGSVHDLNSSRLNESIHSQNSSVIVNYLPPVIGTEVQRATTKTVIVNPNPVSKTVIQQVVDTNNQPVATSIFQERQISSITKTPAILCSKEMLPTPERPLRNSMGSLSQNNLNDSGYRVSMTPATLNRISSSHNLSSSPLPPTGLVSKTPILVQRTLHPKDLPKI